MSRNTQILRIRSKFGVLDLDDLTRLAMANRRLLVCGETGVGKTTLAHEICRRLTRHWSPFRHVYCAGIDKSRLASALLCQESGNCVQFKKRKKQQGFRGTLLLDGIDELSPADQESLVNYLRLSSCRGVRNRHLELRLPCCIATSSFCDSSLKMSTDLIPVFSSATIHIPPLRERPNEILMLIEEFLNRFASLRGELPPGAHYSFSPSAERRLLQYSWPGNLQELANVVKQSLLFNSNRKHEQLEIPDTALLFA